MFYVQYISDGTITGAVLSYRGAPEVAHPVYQLTLPEWQDISGKRVNVETGTLEDTEEQ